MRGEVEGGGDGRGMKGEVVEGEWYMGEVECVSVYE